MSSRKTLSIGTKSDNGPALSSTITNTNETDNVTMGSNLGAVSEIPKVDSESVVTPTIKDFFKSESKSPNEPKRVTRNSPLLLTSPNSKKEHRTDDSEYSESEDSTCTIAPKKLSQIRGRKPLKETKESKEVKESKDGKEGKDEKECTEGNIELKDNSIENEKKIQENCIEKEIKEIKDSKSNKSVEIKSSDDLKSKEANNVDELKQSNEKVKIKDSKEDKDQKEQKESSVKSKDADETKNKDKDNEGKEKDSKESKIVKDIKEKNTKESKEQKEVPNNSSSAATSTVTIQNSQSSSSSSNGAKPIAHSTNRLTRKAFADEKASQTRITRNRILGNNSSSTPLRLARPYRRKINKMPAPIVEPSSKRKRSIEDTSPVEPGTKFIKIEAKDESEIMEEDCTGNTSINDLDTVKIKQEIIESDESSVSTSSTRGRGRSRKAQSSRISFSPSLRATRQTKMSSTSPSLSTSSTASEPKKRRITTSGSTMTRSSSASLLKDAVSITSHPPDEDSKDSLASSIDDIVLANIKREKMLHESEDGEYESYEKSSSAVKAEKMDVACEQDITAPLSVLVTADTSAKISVVNDSTKTTETKTATSTEGSEKSASLSPDMVSEGLSVISVKQFYKKPEFMENNLGIEKDPQLGEILQKVNTEKENNVEKEIKNENNTEKNSSIEEKNNEKEKENDIEKENNIQKENNIEKENITEDENVNKNENSIEQKNNIVNENNIQTETDIRKGNDIEKKNNIEKETEELCTAKKDVEMFGEPEQNDNNDSVKEGELRVEDNEDRKSLKQDDDCSFSTGNISPLVIDDEDTNMAETDDMEKLAINDSDNDDDITIAESESVSMENNPSIDENTTEDQDDIDKDLNFIAKDIDNESISVNKSESEINEVAKIENEDKCDNEKAKLEIKTVSDKHKFKDVKLITKNTSTDEQKNSKDTKSELKNVCGDVEETAEVIEIEEKDNKETANDIENPKLSTENKENLTVIIEQKVTEATKENVIKDSIDACNEENKENMVTAEEIEDKAETTKHKDDKNDSDKMEELEDHKDQEMAELIMDDEKMDIDEKDIKKDESNIECSDDYKVITRDEDSTSVKSVHSSDASWVTVELDNVEEARQKEQHFQKLGLVSHKTAYQLHQHRQEKKRIQNTVAAVEASRKIQLNKRNGKNTAPATSQEYTGTLKTVIKLNRSASTSNNNGRKAHNQQANKDATNGGSGIRRQSLKMTFQKGRARAHGNNDRLVDSQSYTEDSYYTIQNENEGANNKTTNLNTQNSNIYTHGRKSYNRSNTTSHTNNTANSATIESSHSEGNDFHASVVNKKDEKEEILIPEKASSFKFHPGRLCEDQCYYCSGKFGLYDTPCHVGQIKSVERQQKILANEEKLTVDNCLCDACFRHVDRRANVQLNKKRLSAPGNMETNAHSLGTNIAEGGDDIDLDITVRKCVVPECVNPAAHSLRRKCIRKSVKKFLLNFDMPSGASLVWLCQTHYDTVILCSGCVLCKRRLAKNHMYHITSDTDRLETALSEMGIPVQLGIGTAVCKLCRYFANLLMKPPDSTKSQKAEFVQNYRKRLLEFHNIHDGSNEVSEIDEDNVNSNKKTEKQKSPHKKKKKDKSVESKELLSPTGSTGSSVQCLSEAVDTADETVAKAQKSIEEGDEVEIAYEAPIPTTDSNSSSSPASISNADKPVSKLQAILQSTNAGGSSNQSSSSPDISNVLRGNPNISMRELFPGEEDLGLNFKAPFGCSGSQRTPEGWTRVQTFLQYDEPTRRLWEELQKPYGNQSSFLRHLILLEKYYRNGDLLLSPNASSNASVYTRQVRQRLNSYDFGHCGGLLTSKPADKEANAIPTLEIQDDDEEQAEEKQNQSKSNEKTQNSANRSPILCEKLLADKPSIEKISKQLNNAVTIIARPKETITKVSESLPQKSLLKERENTSKETNAATTSSATSTVTITTAATVNNAGGNSRSILKANLLGINKSVEILPISSSSNITPKPTNATVTTAATSKQQKILEVANKLLESQEENALKSQQATGASLLTSPPELVRLQRRPLATGSGISVKQAPPTNTNNSSASLLNSKRTQLMNNNNTHQHRIVKLPDTLTPQERQQCKSWRPTLMPVEENQHKLSKNGPFYQTADGRKLPSLVQVQSGGKPFLISIFDYNRMCILRREKLLRDQMLKQTAKNRQEQRLQQQQQHQQQQHQQQQQQQQQQQLHKNPTSTATNGGSGAANLNKNAIASKQIAHQQLMQLQFLQYQQNQQKQQQQQQAAAALKAATNRYQTIAPKPSISNSTATAAPNPVTNNIASNYGGGPPMISMLTNSSSTANPGMSFGTASWLWNNFPDSNQLMLNAAAARKLPTLLSKPNVTESTPTATITSKQQQQQQQQHQHQQLVLDNTLMSKIPKSLTVIPQHKLMASSSSSATNSNVGGGNNMKE